MRWFLVVAAVSLAVTGSASGELVARAPDGMIAVTPRGAPLVGYVSGAELLVARRGARGHWIQQQAAQIARGSRLAAFAAGSAGPVAGVIGPGDRSLAVFCRQQGRLGKTRLTDRLRPDLTPRWARPTLGSR